jgi:hypothetical protein
MASAPSCKMQKADLNVPLVKNYEPSFHGMNKLHVRIFRQWWPSYEPPFIAKETKAPLRTNIDTSGEDFHDRPRLACAEDAACASTPLLYLLGFQHPPPPPQHHPTDCCVRVM